MKRLYFVLTLAVVFGSCSFSLRGDKTPVYPTQNIYLSYPHLMEFRNKYDRASSFYYMGDLESSIHACDLLLNEIRDLKEIDHPKAICEHLDSLEVLTFALKNKSIDERDRLGWERHISTVLDSIARHHVVEEEIDITMNWRTKYWLDYFQGKGRRYFERWLGRVEVYRDIIEPILISKEIPRDLLYLAVIESGLNPRAESVARAVGPWQFLAGTGRVFNLRINWWIDERRDIIASTYAAAHYLKHLHSLFGSWELALAAYNCGEYRVAHAISRQETKNYWRLRLPTQTKWFVPKFMAALEIGRNPDKYGFDVPKLPSLEFDIIEIRNSTDLRVIAKAASCTYTHIKKLNPALKRWATPPDMIVEVKVPEGTGKTVLQKLAGLEPEERVSWHRHIIQRGETVSTIARRYDISQAELIRMNEIRNPRRIRTGKTLIVPVREEDARNITIRPLYKEEPDLPDKIKVAGVKIPKGHRRIDYTIVPGDNLSHIAERFNTSLKDLRRWNKLEYRSMIKAGDKLIIYVPPGFEYAGDSGDKIRLVYVVKEGDTLNSISTRYNTSVRDILEWNKGLDKNRILPGKKITILVDPNQAGPPSKK